MAQNQDTKRTLRRLWLLFSQTVTIGCGVALAVRWFGIEPAQSPFKSDPISTLSTLGLPAVANDFSAAVERAAPAVVNIFSRRIVPGEYAEELGSDWNSYPELHMKALGSGVIVSSTGDILTNYHVVEGISNLFVALPDGRSFEAVLLGSDPETDLALVHIQAESLPTITLGESDHIKVGQTVLAIGNPFDVGQTVTSGIVSALGRHGFGLNSYEDFIQTDAAINEGNSGGALIDLEGKLIGINSAIFSPNLNEGFIGIGFAIPVSIICRVLPAMMAGKSIERGYLGFVPRQFSQELAQDLGLAVQKGVMVKEIIPESPAEVAGLKPFDIVLAVNGKPVQQANRLLQEIAHLKPGSTASVDILRGKEKLTIELPVSQRPRGSLEKEALIPLEPNDDSQQHAPS